jgi:hypothetical protein
MTPEQKTLAIWGGGLAAALIAGWIALGMRGERLDELQGAAEGLTRKYAELYPKEGIPVVEATKKWKGLLEHQEAALKDAEAAMVPSLPRNYLDTDLSSAAGQVRTDLLYLKQKADRQKVKLPAALPFEEGLDNDAKVRGTQLASLYLYRNALDACMDAGATRITGVHVGKASTDPNEKYALFTCDIELSVTYEQAQQLMLDLLQKQGRAGFGIRALSLEHDKTSNERMNITVSLLTANDPAWGLKGDQGARPGQPGGGGGGRFGKMGG